MTFFSWFLSLQLVCGAAVMGLFAVDFAFAKLSAAGRLKLHYGCLCLVFLIPLGSEFFQVSPSFEPIVKVWNAHQAYPSASVSPSADLGVVNVGKSVSLNAWNLNLFLYGLCFGAVVFAIFNLLRGQVLVHRLLRRAFLYKSAGRVRVVISEDCRIPFSYRTWSYAYAVLPSYLVEDRRNLSLALAHELQHHRQGDTLWVYPRMMLSAIGVLNPFMYLWNRKIDEIQEFACDEALVGRQSFVVRDYARCLIQVAETAWIEESVPAGATGMILLSHGQLLNRRIQRMFQEPKFHGKFAWALPLMLVGALIGATAFAAKGVVHDRRITMSQARELLRNTKTGLPVRVNEDVLKWLNHYVGTPEGRQTAKEGLRRMEIYREMIGEKIKAYHVPSDLMAIPLIESCYKNLPDPNRHGVGAGIWMFIASTARHFGLRVDEIVDERLNEEKETEAAMRYLLGNKLFFDDWELSIIAYNAGERKVRDEMNRVNTRDAWELVSRGNFSKETRDYLPKLNAAILIMNSPHLVE